MNNEEIYCKINNGKSAFSLAETMIMLMIVAIIMAVSAPLITRKAAADARRLILTGQDGGADVVVAPANLQTFGIGTTNPINSENGTQIKLHVNGGSILNGSVRIGDNNNLILNNDGNGIFQINGTDGTDTSKTNTFKFNTKDGTTNIVTMPRYDDITNSKILTQAKMFVASTDGYIYTKRQVGIVYNDTSATVPIETNDKSSSYIKKFDLSKTDFITTNSSKSYLVTGFDNDLSAASSFDDIQGITNYSLIPILKGTKFECFYADCLFMEATSRIND